MYITESFICFSSSLLGMEQKIKIPIADITKLTKKKALGLFNSSLQIVTKLKIYNFCSMTFRDEAYDRIFALWRVQSPYSLENNRGEGINSSNEEDDAKLPNAATNDDKFEKQ